MATSRKDRVNKYGVKISAQEYEAYQTIRRNRAKINRQVTRDYTTALNRTYASEMYSKRMKEKEGKRFTINDIKSRYDFESILKSGEKYLNYEAYKEKKAKEYMYNMRQALINLSGNDSAILERFDDIMSELQDAYKLDDIYANSEELDLSFIYVESMEQGIERLDYTLDVLEQKIKQANEE